MTNAQKLPKNWDPSRISNLIDHYESQSEDDEAAEIEAAFEKEGMTMIAIPVDMVEEVRALVARRQKSA